VKHYHHKNQWRIIPSAISAPSASSFFHAQHEPVLTSAPRRINDTAAGLTVKAWDTPKNSGTN
jgi:hypothetical protein